MAGHAIRFFSFLRLAEGEFEGKPFILRPWQAFIVGNLFGWYVRDEDGRLVRESPRDLPSVSLRTATGTSVA